MEYLTDGTSALAPQDGKGLYVIFGSKGAVADERCAHERAKQAKRLRSSALLFVVGVAVLLAAALWLGDALVEQRRAAASSQISYVEISVQAGDTLWGLARARPVNGLTTRELVDLLEEVNDLDSAGLCIGERILVPASGE